MNFHLMRPEYLWALVPAIVLGFALWRLGKRSGSWSSVISPELLPHLLGPGAGIKRRNFALPILALWSLAVFAAAGPSWQKIPQPIHQRQDALVLVLDLSYSMIAGDLAPSRIDRARQKLLDLLETRREGQTGLIAYAGDAHIVTPLTDDTPTIANLLPALHPNIMPVPGSAPDAAIENAVSLLQSAGIREGRILLITDGISSADREQIADSLAGTGASLAIMGVGTQSGAPLALPRGGFLKDDSGAIVMPTLQESPLRGLARDSGGRYMRMQIDDSDLAYLLAELPLGFSEQTMALDRSADTWEDQGYWIVLLLILPALALFRRGWIVCLLPLLFLPQANDTKAGVWDDLWLTPDQQGQRALEQQDNSTAASLFDDSDWAGTAAYRDQDYETAAQHFSKQDSADAWYNKANALARAGQLEEAMQAYRESLKRDPEGQDAQHNLDLLEQLQQQQEQQQQQQGDQQSGEQDDSEQNQSQQDQSEQDNSGQEQNQQESGDPSEQQSSSPDQQQQDSSAEQSDASDEQQGDEQEQQAQQPQDQDSSQTEPGQELMEKASAAAAESPDQEKDQAMEQWLRRVPDDPSGLLREKFRYESRLRQQQGKGKDDDTYW